MQVIDELESLLSGVKLETFSVTELVEDETIDKIQLDVIEFIVRQRQLITEYANSILSCTLKLSNQSSVSQCRILKECYTLAMNNSSDIVDEFRSIRIGNCHESWKRALEKYDLLIKNDRQRMVTLLDKIAQLLSSVVRSFRDIMRFNQLTRNAVLDIIV